MRRAALAAALASITACVVAAPAAAQDEAAEDEAAEDEAAEHEAAEDEAAEDEAAEDEAAEDEAAEDEAAARAGALAAPAGAWTPAETEIPEAAADEGELVRLPGPLAQRPLTLPGGVGRISQGLFVRGARGTFAVPIVPVGLALGVLDDLELGLAWPLPWDPTFYARARFVVDTHVELGGAISVTAPVLTEGDSLARVSVPLLIRPTEWLRIDTALEVELLFASQLSPLAIVPLTVVVNPVRGFFLGAQGSVEWLDGTRWQGEAGGFLGFTVATPTGAIMDGRFTVTSYLPQAEFALAISVAFYPRFWS